MRWASVLAAWGMALAALPAVAADVRQIESVGAEPIWQDGRKAPPPREAAVKRAVLDAVLRVASELQPQLDPADADAVLADVLGDDPFAYTTRFRILEDRGERPALFSREGGAETEYVVVVAAQVDADRVRKRLGDRGLLGPSGDRRTYRTFLVLEDLDGYAPYAALQQYLVRKLRARSAVPVELQRGRAVLAVVAERDSRSLLDALLAARDPELRIEPLRTEGDTLYLRVRLVPPPPPPVGASGRTRSRRN